MNNYEPASEKVREEQDRKGYSPANDEGKETRITTTGNAQHSWVDGKWIWEDGSWRYVG